MVVAIAAATVPTLLNAQTTPSPTFMNQAMAFALWPAFLLTTDLRPGWREPGALFAALLLLALAALATSVFGALPAALSLSVVASLAAALVIAAGGAGMRARPDAEILFAAFCWGWVGCGFINIGIALIQVFAPDWTDGELLATSGIAGRAVGNLRQPNHLSSLLLWHCIAVIALLELGRLRRGLAAALLGLGVFAVVLTASRTGLVSVLLLALWGLLDRGRLSRFGQRLLWAAPLVYAVAWWLMDRWAKVSQHAFGGAARLAETDISGSRFAIWRDTLDLIIANPWRGVGFGEFNVAWTLTPFPQRPVAFFDHTHNLPLQLAVELGLPLAALVMGLLGLGLWLGARRAWQTGGKLGTTQRCAMLMVLMIGLHSLLEYPLWYAYFLLPAAWVFGYALQGEPGTQAPPVQPGLASTLLSVAALLVVAGAALSVFDYRRVVVIFSPGSDGRPLEQRIVEGQKSLFFAHHADYAAVTSGMLQPDPAKAFDRVPHYLLDTRLMMTWAKDLAERGRLDQARHLAARLREFHKADAEEFFKDCPDAPKPAAPGLPFQCELPQRVPDWRDFLRD